MAEWLTLARPYAKAAFTFAKEKGELSQWEQALALAAEATEHAEFEAYIDKPSLKLEAKIAAFEGILAGQAPAGFENLIRQLAEHDRLPLMPLILQEFIDLKAKDQDVLDALIESAFELKEDEVSLIADSLKRRFGTQINTEVVLKPELIAGTRIHIANEVIDDSAIAKLNDLKASLLA